MKSLSGVGLGLSIVFGFLLLALLAELYYLLWWKKRLTNRELLENDYSNPTREFFYMFCCKCSSSSSSSMNHHTTGLNPQEIRFPSEEHPNKDLLVKDNNNGSMEENHELVPRFLFTIIEETKEDLESEESKSNNKSRVGSRQRSLSDLMLSVETPYLTPLASPPFLTPPLTPMEASLGFNPLFESAADAEFNRLRSSPTPKFKFLQEAEEKLNRKMEMEEDEENVGDMTPPSKYLKDEDQDGSFITIIVDRSKEREFSQIQYHQEQQQFHSSTSQVLPLSFSSSTLNPPC